MKIYIDFDGTLYNTTKLNNNFINIFNKYNIDKDYIKKLMNNVGITIADREIVKHAIEKAELTNANALAIQLDDGKIIKTLAWQFLIWKIKLMI